MNPDYPLLGYHLWLLTGRSQFGIGEHMGTPYYMDDTDAPSDVSYARAVLRIGGKPTNCATLGVYAAVLACSALSNPLPRDPGHLFSRGLLRVPTLRVSAEAAGDPPTPIPVRAMAPDADHPFSLRWHPDRPTTEGVVEISYVSDTQANLRMDGATTRVAAYKSLFMLTVDFPTTFQHTARFAFDSSEAWGPGVTVRLEIAPQRYPYAAVARAIMNDNKLRNLLLTSGLSEPAYSSPSPVLATGALGLAIMRNAHSRAGISHEWEPEGATALALPPIGFIENQLSMVWSPLTYTSAPLTYDPA